MRPGEPKSKSCIYCRVKCNKYKISDTEVSLQTYKDQAKTCEFYTEIKT